ncbi:MAG: hypothetical protein EHM70_16925 [Chloroflexota bacterium]|nr:MAG: hypothetical protein EHM70_16925 [Chloroflexota bacterium]
MSETPTPSDKLKSIIESARRLGMEMDEAEAMQWLQDMSSSRANEVTVDLRTGVFGDKVVMLDFDPHELARFREIGRLVEFKDEPGVVETALALSGSSAQSKVQSFPGDCDYFERVNILAESRQQACTILSRIMREKALSTLKGPAYLLIEVKFGSYPCNLVRAGSLIKAGAPVAWEPDEIVAGHVDACLPDGSPRAVTWEEVSSDPGWCKLDWVVADPTRGQVANASNMLDVTWEAPDGTITPLDGYLDPYFQEVYLEAGSAPIFSKLAQHVSANALEDYVAALEREVQKYLSHAPTNYGKVAKRMYNIFRLTGRYEEAAFLRELFDEPTTILYQVWSLIRTIDDCVKPGASITIDNLLAQTDHLILAVVEALEGDQESEIVRLLLRLRNALAGQESGQSLTAQAEAARAEVINVVNNFFYEKLVAVPAIKEYIEQKQANQNR